MTDSRLPGRWLTDVAMEQLSDRAFRTFCGSLMWSNEQGTDGRIPPAAMKYLHPLGVDAATRKELFAAALWRPDKDGVQVPDWNSKMGQEMASTVESRREGNRVRQQRKREADRAKQGSSSPVTSRVTSRTGQDRQDRTGQGSSEEVNPSTGEVTSWATAKPGEPGAWVQTGEGEFSEVGAA